MKTTIVLSGLSFLAVAFAQTKPTLRCEGHLSQTLDVCYFSSNSIKHLRPTNVRVAATQRGVTKRWNASFSTYPKQRTIEFFPKAIADWPCERRGQGSIRISVKTFYTNGIVESAAFTLQCKRPEMHRSEISTTS